MKKAIFLALLLAGCQTTEERLAADDRQCQSYGVAIGSPPYVECRMRLDKQHSQAQIVNSLSPGSFLLGNISR